MIRDLKCSKKEILMVRAAVLTVIASPFIGGFNASPVNLTTLAPEKHIQDTQLSIPYLPQSLTRIHVLNCGSLGDETDWKMGKSEPQIAVCEFIRDLKREDLEQAQRTAGYFKVHGLH